MSHAEQCLAEMILEYMREETTLRTRASLTCMRDILDCIDGQTWDEMKEVIFDCVLRELRSLHMEEILRDEAKAKLQAGVE